MRIGVSALAMRGHAAALDSGIARYCAGLVDAWCADGGRHRLEVWLAPGFSVPERWRDRPGITFHTARGPWARYKTLWEWFSAGGAAVAAGCDVWFSTAHAVPLRCPVPTVLSVQDLFTFSHPQFYTWKHRLVIGTALRHALRRAAGLVAISEHTRDELARRFAVPAARVTVTPLGLGNGGRGTASPTPAAPPTVADLAALGIGGDRYLLTLSTVEPRKNLPRLFAAFARLAARPEHAGLRLVVAGNRGWKTSAIYRRPAELGIAERVDFLGYVPDADLPALFAGCAAFVLPSIVEGFGLPVLEAMAFGAPVVCSHSGSLREVGGDVPIYFDPLDIEDMTRAIERRLSDPTPRPEVAARGRERAAGFSWAEAARRTLGALERAGAPT
jgi:glycosyltransferase involved in cell wall biosynthesis